MGSGIDIQYELSLTSIADLGVDSKILQIRPMLKVSAQKMSKTVFCIFVGTLIFLTGIKEV